MKKGDNIILKDEYRNKPIFSVQADMGDSVKLSKKYFDKYETWTPWKKLFSDTMIAGVTYKFEWRTDNKRKVEVRVEDIGKAVACCSPEDKFDIRKGTAIAFYRMVKKLCDYEISEESI